MKYKNKNIPNLRNETDNWRSIGAVSEALIKLLAAVGVLDKEGGKNENDRK